MLYERASGQFVMHRIRAACNRDGSLDILGDAQTETETGILPQQVFARATAVCRKGRQLQPGDFLWELFRGPWLWVIPLRRPIVRAWCAFKKRRT
ncbi:MAG: hypothetical protein ACLUNO_01765 [Oscillospiraceae bacterium]